MKLMKLALSALLMSLAERTQGLSHWLYDAAERVDPTPNALLPPRLAASMRKWEDAQRRACEFYAGSQWPER